MRQCFFFNPENDLALASGLPFFQPSKKIIQFASDLSMLPIWYAPNGSLVISRSKVCDNWNMELFSRLGISSSWISLDEYNHSSFLDDILFPWGWNPSLVHWWNGLNHSINIDFNLLRESSSRAFTIDILSFLQNDNLLSSSLFLPKKLYTDSEIEKFKLSHDSFVLKAPWSGSGKGLFWSNGLWRDKLSEWSHNILSSQGYLLGEVVYEKQVDFAMEFRCMDDEVQFIGYSLFHTDKFGHYNHNFLSTDEWIENHLMSKLQDPELLLRTKERLRLFIKSNLASFYNGYLGIDMMLFGENPEKCQLHPCVEVNLRMNMGIVSRILYNRFVSESVTGIFKVKTFPTFRELSEFDTFMQRKYPLLIDVQRVVAGYLPLTVVNSDSRSLAYLLCNVENE